MHVLYVHVDINMVAFNLTLMIIVQTKIVVVGLEMTGSFLDVSIVFLVGVNPAGLQKKIEFILLFSVEIA